LRRCEKAPDRAGCWYGAPVKDPETTEAYEDLRGINPRAPVGMLESGTPGEPAGYEFAISKYPSVRGCRKRFVGRIRLRGGRCNVLERMTRIRESNQGPVLKSGFHCIDDRTKVGTTDDVVNVRSYRENGVYV
jgi:hypothetical protein